MPESATLLVVGGSLLGAVGVNVYLLPEHHLVSALYTIPVLIAALRGAPRAVVVTGTLAVVLYLVSAYHEHSPPAVWPFGVIALLVVSALAVLLAAQTNKTSQRAQDAEDQQHETVHRAQEAAAAHQRLQQFMGMASHDLRNPLATALGYAHLLRQYIDTALRPRSRSVLETEQQALGALNGIEGAVQRMRRLTDDFSDASRIGADHFDVQSAPTDVVAVIRHIVDQHQLAAAGHRLVIDAPERLEGMWDRERLSQIFVNLISNAIAYSPPGGEVRVTVQRLADEAVVSVSDEGVGMTPDEVQRLFQPYSRLEHVQAVTGTGLGLYISKGIAEAHGGRTWVTSVEGKGSIFSVALPLAR
jgi:signal transduction histidine kinase